MSTSWHQEQNPTDIKATYTPHPIKWKVIGGKDMLSCMLFDTWQAADEYVANVERLHGYTEMIIPPKSQKTK